jgi:hypothetical protein
MNGNLTYFAKDDQWLFQQDQKNGYLLVSHYRIWSLLNRKFSLNYQQTKELITTWMENGLGCEGLTLGSY